MYSITERHLILITVIAVFLFFPIVGSAQDFQITDTSYFIPGDNDFNLIVSADKSDIANVQMLIKRGANVNVTTTDGVTPLMYAVQNGNLEMVKMLVEDSADIDKKPVSGTTALIVAAKQNFYEIAEYLVKKSAALNIRDENGVSAVQYAAAYNNFDIMDMLIFYGADKDFTDLQGNTPLIIAAFNNCFEAVDLLIQNTANLNLADNNGFTALMVAIQQDNSEIVSLLLDKGADVNPVNKSGMSALAFAVVAKDLPLIERLVEQGADVNQITNSNTNILELAKKTKDDEIINFLETKDAKGTLSPSFDAASLGLVFDFNSTDYMNGLQLGVLDSKYQLGINFGFLFRPAANRILADVSNVTYQFWERRYFFYLGLEKRFKIIETSKNAQSGPFIGVNEVLTFGGYRGTTLNPKVRMVTSPFIGWYLNKRTWGIRAGYEYLNFKTPEIIPGRFSITLTFIDQFGRYINKKINWLN
jgi:uncharacterized protein